MICLSVWSTLMTSSIGRETFFANSSLMGIARSLGLENPWPVIRLRVEGPHETQARDAVEGAGIEENARADGAPHQLFQEGGSAVEREEGPGTNDEEDVAPWLGAV